jgi:ring-1,2-phenylacetyl-CoA epoxidase subunit PaaC
MEEKNRQALIELLLSLADDDFILSYRGSEWLGLAPHIEEDVAFSSINQDMMGHAAIYYRILDEELGAGKADELSHLRKLDKYRNAVLLEEKNGTGTYLENPDYDWAFAVVRNYFYATHKRIRLDSLKNSSFEPLAFAARRIATEHVYHLMHWETWFKQLVNSTEEARNKMLQAIVRCWNEMGGVLSLGPKHETMVAEGYIEDEESLRQKWLETISKLLENSNISIDTEIGMKKGNGRQGEHTEDLKDALATLSEVYAKDPVTDW